MTTRLSPGNTDGFDAEVVGQSNDARRIVFRTPEQLTPSDTDSEFDLYALGGGQTVKVSPGNGPHEARISGVSSDGGTVVFTTQDRLTADDTDSRADAYRVAGGSIARVSTGPRGGNSPDHPVGFEVNAVGGDVLFMSDDGTRVVFGTPEQMTADDTDHQFDSYLWTPAGVQKVTPGNGEVDPTGWDGAATVVGGTPDGSRLLFITRERLTGDDTDSAPRPLRVGRRRGPAGVRPARRAATTRRATTSTARRSSTTTTAAASSTCPRTARGSSSRRPSGWSPPTPTTRSTSTSARAA